MAAKFGSLALLVVCSACASENASMGDAGRPEVGVQDSGRGSNAKVKDAEPADVQDVAIDAQDVGRRDAQQFDAEVGPPCDRGRFERVASGRVSELALSGDGRMLAVITEGRLLPTIDSDALSRDLYLVERSSGATTLVSRHFESGTSLGGAGNPSMDDDGRYVVFDSAAAGLVQAQSPFTGLFHYDVTTSELVELSLAPNGSAADGDSFGPVISGDGSLIGFVSVASNLTASDTNGTADAFVYDKNTGAVTRRSVDETGGDLDDPVLQMTLSKDGSTIAYVTARDLYVRREGTVTSLRLTLSIEDEATLNFPALSRDGAHLAFTSNSALLSPGTRFETFLLSLSTRTATRASVPTSNGVLSGNVLGPAAISPSGRFMAFDSDASNLPGGGGRGVYLRDFALGRTQRLTPELPNAPFEGASMRPFLASARFVGLATALPLVAEDTDALKDAYIVHLCADD